MRFTRMLAPAVALLLAVSVEASASPVQHVTDMQAALQAPMTLSLSAAQTPAPKADVTIQLNDSRTVWYLDPVWITVGLVALALVIALIIAASRSNSGSSTTVVR